MVKVTTSSGFQVAGVFCLTRWLNRGTVLKLGLFNQVIDVNLQ